jgi:hypothetical protein
LYKIHNETRPNNMIYSLKEKHTANTLKRKLITHNAMIAKADKGN